MSADREREEVLRKSEANAVEQDIHPPVAAFPDTRERCTILSRKQ